MHKQISELKEKNPFVSMSTIRMDTIRLDIMMTLKVMAKIGITIPKPEPFIRLAGPLARVPSGVGQGVPPPNLFDRIKRKSCHGLILYG